MKAAAALLPPSSVSNWKQNTPCTACKPSCHITTLDEFAKTRHGIASVCWGAAPRGVCAAWQASQQRARSVLLPTCSFQPKEWSRTRCTWSDSPLRATSSQRLCVCAGVSSACANRDGAVLHSSSSRPFRCTCAAVQGLSRRHREHEWSRLSARLGLQCLRSRGSHSDCPILLPSQCIMNCQ